MRNGSLWNDVVFEKEGIFHEFDFKTSDLEFEVSTSSIWKHTTSCDKGVFSSIINISQLGQPIELLTCICWDTQSEKAGLRQLYQQYPMWRFNVFKTKIVFTIIFIIIICLITHQSDSEANTKISGCKNIMCIVASYVIDPHMFLVPNFDSCLPRNCASCTGDRSYAVYSRSVFSSGWIMLRIKFPVVGYAQIFIKWLIFGTNH